MDKYIELTESAKTHNVLYHYTNLDALKCILKNQSLRLSRIDKVNDPKENDRIKSLWNTKVFLLCFTHGQNNSEYFYNKYGTIRLAFNQDALLFDRMYYESELINAFDVLNDEIRRRRYGYNSYDKKCDWCVYDNTIADVFYSDNLDSHVARDGFESNAGLIKAKCGCDNNGNMCDWEIEAETRLRVALRPIGLESVLDKKTNSFYYPVPNFEYIYTRLPEISQISISPYISESEKNEILKVLEEYGVMQKLHP